MINDCTGFARISVWERERSPFAFVAHNGFRAALLILDWVLNLDREVGMFWNRPRGTAAVLYFAMRWTSLLAEGLAMISPSVTNSDACKTFYPS